MKQKKTEILKKLSPEQIKKDIQIIKTGAYPEKEKATIGENRGQLFVRIPKVVSKRLKLQKGQDITFLVYEKDGKQCLEVKWNN